MTPYCTCGHSAESHKPASTHRNAVSLCIARRCTCTGYTAVESAKSGYDDSAIRAEILRKRREDVRDIEVRDVGTEYYEQGLSIIVLSLNEYSSQTMQVNPFELAVLRDKIDAYLADLEKK